MMPSTYNFAILQQSLCIILKEKKKKRKNVCIGAVRGCALVSAQVLYLAKDDNIIAAL